MSLQRLLDRLTSPYAAGVRIVELAEITSNGQSYNIEILWNLQTIGASPFVIKTITHIGSNDMDLVINFKDGADADKQVTVTIPAKTWPDEAILVDITGVTDTGTCLEIVNVTTGTNAGSVGDKVRIVALAGNIGKIWSSISEETMDAREDISQKTMQQRYLSQALDYGLDMHGAEVGTPRVGDGDEAYRSRIQLKKTFGSGNEPVTTDAFVRFADLQIDPAYVSWYTGQWILGQSALNDECVLGLLLGVGKLMTEVHIVRLDTTKTLAELQNLANSIAPISTYTKVVLIWSAGSGASFEDLFSADSNNDYTNPDGFEFEVSP